MTWVRSGMAIYGLGYEMVWDESAWVRNDLMPSHIGTVLNVYAAACSARTNDFIDNSRPCDHKRKLCESGHITP